MFRWKIWSLSLRKEEFTIDENFKDEVLNQKPETGSYFQMRMNWTV